jgi:hypothetical protein
MNLGRQGMEKKTRWHVEYRRAGVQDWYADGHHSDGTCTDWHELADAQARLKRLQELIQLGRPKNTGPHAEFRIVAVTTEITREVVE